MSNLCFSDHKTFLRRNRGDVTDQPSAAKAIRSQRARWWLSWSWSILERLRCLGIRKGGTFGGVWIWIKIVSFHHDDHHWVSFFTIDRTMHTIGRYSHIVLNDISSIFLRKNLIDDSLTPADFNNHHLVKPSAFHPDRVAAKIFKPSYRPRVILGLFGPLMKIIDKDSFL